MRVYRDRCRHFTGIQNGTCDAGVRYLDVRDSSGEGPYRWPCLDIGRPCTTACDKRSLLTQDEHVQLEHDIKAAGERYLARLADEVCPQCGKPTEPSRVVGRCRYSACGHRQGQVSGEGDE